MPHRILAAALALSACTVAPEPGDDERAVRDTVQAFFDVIGSRDVEAGRQLVVPEGVFVNVRTEDGRRAVRHFRNADWLDGLAAETRDFYEAFDGTPTILITGDVAVVWSKYVFDIDGSRSHTGIDAFNLIRTDEGWRIAGGVYSVVR